MEAKRLARLTADKLLPFRGSPAEPLPLLRVVVPKSSSEARQYRICSCHVTSERASPRFSPTWKRDTTPALVSSGLGIVASVRCGWQRPRPARPRPSSQLQNVTSFFPDHMLIKQRFSTMAAARWLQRAGEGVEPDLQAWPQTCPRIQPDLSRNQPGNEKNSDAIDRNTLPMVAMMALLVQQQGAASLEFKQSTMTSAN